MRANAAGIQKNAPILIPQGWLAKGNRTKIAAVRVGNNLWRAARKGKGMGPI
jgi:hypothetical protein